MEDRAKLVAYLMDKGATCTQCGTAPWEWEADPGAYEAALHDCMGCKVKETFRSHMANDLPAGQSVTLISGRQGDRLRYDPRARPRRPLRKRTRRRQE